MNKSTFIVLILMVTLGLIYLVTKKEKVSVGVNKLSLPIIHDDEAKNISLSSLSGYDFVKENGQWYLKEIEESKEAEKKFLADKQKVELLISSLATIRQSYYVTSDTKKFAEYGLEGEDATTIELSQSIGKPWSLVIGKQADASGRYVKTPHEDLVFVVRGDFHNILRQKLDDWRDKKIVHFDGKDVEKISWSQSNAVYFALEASEDGWEAPGEKDFRVDEQQLVRYFGSLNNTVSLEFVDDPPILSYPVFSIALSFKGGDSTELDFYRVKDEYLVKNPKRNQVFKISEYSFNDLKKDADDFQNLHVLKFPEEKIVDILIDSDKGPVKISKNEDAWTIVEPKELPKEFEFDERNVRQFLNKLVNLKAKKVVDKESKPKETKWKEEALVKLTDSAQNTYILRGKKADERNYYVLGNLDKKVYLVSEASLRFLNEGVEHFKKLEAPLPIIDERTQGFDKLPIEVKRQFLENNKKILEEKAEKK